MARLPVIGGDNDSWGDILNEYLLQSHNASGSLKGSALPYGTTSQTAAEGDDSRIVGAQQRSVLTTKGDLYAATDTAVVERVGVGADGQILQADSSQATGMGWVGVDDPYAASLGLGVLTAPAFLASSSHTLAAGVLAFALVRATKPQQISQLGVWLFAGGSTSTGVNGLAIYSEAGTLLRQTDDMSSAMSNAGYAEGNLTSTLQITIGTYYIAILTHFSSIPTIRSIPVNADIPSIAGHFTSVFLTSQTDFPASFTPGSANLNSSFYVMGGR